MEQNQCSKDDTKTEKELFNRFARLLLPEIKEFYASKEEQEKFAQWQKEHKA